jgi:flagellar protein FliO/FliZ
MGNQFFFSILNESGIKEGGAPWVSAISIMILFVLVLFGAYFTTRFLGKFQSNQHKNSYIKILEAISVGPNKTVQLVKVGEEYMAIGVTKDRITYLKSIDKDQIELTLFEERGQMKSFNQYFNKFRQDKQNENKED